MSAVLYYLIPPLLILVAIRKICELKWGKCKNSNDLGGKVAIVTGANSGIGYEITKELLKRHCYVILACRNRKLAENAMGCLKKELGDVNLEAIAMDLDLGSLKSVRQFAQLFKSKFPCFDLLINNAGVAYRKQSTGPKLTEDGFEIHFGVNHVGHFFLTDCLLNNIRKGGRIIVISSTLAESAEIDFQSFTGKTAPANTNLYANSKLANLYFAHELTSKLRHSGINVYSVFPGWVYTNLFRHSIKWYHYILVSPIAFLFMRTPKQGAQTAIYCATDPLLDNETGLYYRNCCHYQPKIQINGEIARKLWIESEKMCASAI